MKAVALNLLVAGLAHQMAAVADDGLSFGAEKPDSIPDKVMWSTKGADGSRTALSLAKLYVALYNSGSLPVQVYTGDTSRQVVEIMRSEKLFVGNEFPVAVDSVLCDLNTDVCSRELVQTDDLSHLTKHVGGYRASKGTWLNSDSTPLVLPNVHLHEVTDFKVQAKPKGISAKDYVKHGKFECGLRYWGFSCLDLVYRLNRHAPAALEPDSEGPAILPLRRFSAIIPTHRDEVHEIQSSVDRHSELWTKSLAENDPRVWITDELSENLVAWGNAFTHSAASNEPRYAEQIDLMAAISHPFKNNDHLPTSMQGQVKIGVLDNQLDADHCDFGDNVTVGESSPTNVFWPEDMQGTEECGEELTGPWNKSHHGTHVVGLIAAGLNMVGIVGLNPHAEIIFHSVNQDHFRDSVSRERLVRPIIMDMLDVSVINVSWQYDIAGGGIDSFMNALTGGGPLSSRLVVASAGNDGGTYPHDDACGIRPACMDYENVISVVGVDAHGTAPAFWESTNKRGSNRGTRFHIAAVAENVLSTAAKNYSIRADGTSHAAPQVTAAASLIYSIYEYAYSDSITQLLPGQVKNRLMYTADLHQHLLKNVFSGRLNVERALAVSEDQFVVADIDDDRNRHLFSGRVSVFGVFKGEDPDFCTPERYENCKTSVIQCKRLSHEVVPVPVDAIRRMYRSDDTKHYVIFYNEARSDRATKLKRITDCQLMSRSQLVVVDTDYGEKRFQVKQIRDFTAAMF